MSLENLHRDLSESFEMSLCHKNVFCTLSAEDNLVTMKTLSAAWVLDECAVNCQVVTIFRVIADKRTFIVTAFGMEFCRGVIIRKTQYILLSL